jgi:AbrB family looped-hinge helix DNA binding protein
MTDNSMKTIIKEGGRIVIPAAFRKALGIKTGDEVLITLENDEIKVISSRQAVARAQALIRSYIPEGRSLSDELIRERRNESKYE